VTRVPTTGTWETWLPSFPFWNFDPHSGSDIYRSSAGIDSETIQFNLSD
jgi:hypothetical protein